MSEYQFDVYVKAKSRRGHHIRFIARLSRKVAEAVLAGIYATVDANGEDAGGGFSEVVRVNGRIVSKAQEDKRKGEAQHG